MPLAWLFLPAPGPALAGPLNTLSVLTAPAVEALFERPLPRPAPSSLRPPTLAMLPALMRSVAWAERPRSLPLPRSAARALTVAELLLTAAARLSRVT